ncbi:hypothetical protein VFPPC_15709 [Pochonia chlamydosporia 170]|uniref:Uncharacterized protein n=1 Tax=Pochonia chlamydosporia 170 TaxID=1380566 RepID=A0A179FR61_METCM|nr:hypothetical protein VFPPC_15709 [Pochonia chlamydosporia 170]OAQ67631.1 hypothetical protein VFPPC_15709 [Pochonia chlamydosporia 170]
MPAKRAQSLGSVHRYEGGFGQFPDLTICLSKFARSPPGCPKENKMKLAAVRICLIQSTLPAQCNPPSQAGSLEDAGCFATKQTEG